MDGMAEEVDKDISQLHWISGCMDSPAGSVPRVKTVISMKDRLGWWKVRWAIARDKFTVDPGLYAVGSPTSESEVFVSANYKMSFDRLRQSLDGIDGWILVIDTLGINVWCAAGKGTFATAAIAGQAEVVRLTSVVSHRRLILPQLAAAGVAAQKVAKETGFRVTYGPVRAEDIRAFLQNGMKASEEMRTVRFPLIDRLILTPVELVVSFKYIFLGLALATLAAGLGRDGYSPERALSALPALMLTLCAAWIGGAFVGPTFLPFLPGRSFSLKGAIAGLGTLSLMLLSGALTPLPGWAFIVAATASFLTMNFTGCSTYTSPSGVRKEMRLAVPMQAVLLLIGVGIWISSLFMGTN